MAIEQGPNVTDPDARTLIASVRAATAAIDYMLCAIGDGDPPNVGEIAHCLADALDALLTRYPSTDAVLLHAAARVFLGLDDAGDSEAVQ